MNVRCKQTALDPIRYVAIEWPLIDPLHDYRSLEVRLSAFEPNGNLLSVKTETHHRNSTSAAIPFTHPGAIEVSLWGRMAGGWSLLSLIHKVHACRDYRQ